MDQTPAVTWLNGDSRSVLLQDYGYVATASIVEAARLLTGDGQLVTAVVCPDARRGNPPSWEPHEAGFLQAIRSYARGLNEDLDPDAEAMRIVTVVFDPGTAAELIETVVIAGT